MAASLHLNELVKFLDTAGSKGWIKPNTASSMKTTCVRVLGDLDEEEKVDVAKIDVDDALTRFANKNSGVASGSLGAYKSRLRSAIKMFTEARANPTGWKPPSSRTARAAQDGKAASASPARAKAKGSRLEAATQAQKHSAHGHTDVAETIGRGLSYPFPLRSDVTITISNIPRDLRAAEVDRIAQFLKALAIGDHK